MQGEIYLWYRLLVLNSAAGDLEVVHVCVGVHSVELSQDQEVRIKVEYLNGLVLGKGGVVG